MKVLHAQHQVTLRSETLSSRRCYTMRWQRLNQHSLVIPEIDASSGKTHSNNFASRSTANGKLAMPCCLQRLPQCIHIAPLHSSLLSTGPIITFTTLSLTLAASIGPCIAPNHLDCGPNSRATTLLSPGLAKLASQVTCSRSSSRPICCAVR